MRHILIVGGGTAGWLTALILKKHLPESRVGPFKISVIEPSNIPRIGVGEATLPSLKAVMHDLELSEREFLKRAHATFKHGVRFADWSEGPGNGTDAFYHLFERNIAGKFQRLAPYHPGDMANKVFDVPINQIAKLIAGRNFRDHLFEFQGVQAALCNRLLPPKTSEMPEYEGFVEYGYHLDAEAFGDWLKEVAISRDIAVIDDTVCTVRRLDNGNIACVETGGGNVISADFFVDCSGFRSVLMRSALDVPFESFADKLLCNSAVTVRLPRRGSEVRPFTTAVARKHGWTWDIDLTSRRAMGYVYSDAHLDNLDAIAQLRKIAGPKANELDVQSIKFDTGYLADFWVGNCAAVGLAAGFVEPLESTGIEFISIGARQLADLLVFQTQGAAPREYTRRMRIAYDDVVDFITMHYVLSKRRDTDFWCDAASIERQSSRLADKLEMWAKREPIESDVRDPLMTFPFESYRQVLYGMGVLPEFPRARSTEAARVAKTSVRRAEAHVLSQLKGHLDTISEFSSNLEAASLSEAYDGSSLTPVGVGSGQLPSVVRLPENQTQRVELCSSTALAEDLNLQGYEREARVPMGEWRNLSADEASAVQAKSSDPQGRVVELVKFEAESSVQQMRRLFSVDESEVDEVMLSAEYKRLLSQITQDVTPYCAGEMRCLGAIWHKPQLKTVTRQAPGMPRIGLHMDSWSKSVIGERQNVPNRLCINIGSSQRYFLFAAIAIEEMAQKSGLTKYQVERLNPTDVGRAYLRRYPNAPILRMCVKPGEAYIAPTENLLHDGSSSSETDISLTFLGRFSSLSDPKSI